MDRLTPLRDSYPATRDELQRVAVHIVARARSQATGRFGLRVTAGGFGTPEYADDLVRVRVSGGNLVRESGGTSGTTNAVMAIDGASLRDLANFAQVDLDAELDVGHDTPPPGDADAPLRIDVASAVALADWYAVVASALDGTAEQLPDVAAVTLTQLWPEHFDVAFDAAATVDRRANLGGSPGDGFHADPYIYVGPWTDDRPGDQTFWNAPFGAVLGYEEIRRSGDPVTRAAEFFLNGVRRLAG